MMLTNGKQINFPRSVVHGIRFGKKLLIYSIPYAALLHPTVYSSPSLYCPNSLCKSQVIHTSYRPFQFLQMSSLPLVCTSQLQLEYLLERSVRTLLQVLMLFKVIQCFIFFQPIPSMSSWLCASSSN